MISSVYLVPVEWVAAVVAVVAILACVNALARQHQPIPAGMAVLAGVFALAMLFTGPELAQAKPGGYIPNLTAEVNMHDRWMENPDMWGEPIGECFTRGQVFVCPTTYGDMEYHPEIPDHYWSTQGGNVGLELAKYYGIKLESNPVTPPVIATYMEQMNKRGLDSLYWLGYQRTSPIKRGDGYWVVYDKAILSVPASNMDLATDPAAVKRLPAGSMLWGFEHPPAGGLDPWTAARKGLLIGGIVLLLAGVVLSRRGRGFAPGMGF